MPKLPIIIEAKGGKKAKKQIKGVGGSIKGLMKSLGPMMMAFVGVQKSMEGLKASVELAGKMDKVSPAFDNLAKASGFSADAFNKFNTALDGTVPKVELMEMANNAMLLGITDNEEQMALNLGFSYGETGVMRPIDILQRIRTKLGYFVVDNIIWVKKNPIPLRNRLTNAYEYIFILAKTPKINYNIQGHTLNIINESVKGY